MSDTKTVFWSLLTLREKSHVFLNPCHHIGETIIRMELLGIPPTCRIFTIAIETNAESSLHAARCQRCCSKNAPKSQVLLVLVSAAIFAKLADSSPKTFEKSSLIVVPPSLNVYEIDYPGCWLIGHHLYRQIVIQEAMSWLSTIGGGFSSLGDKFQDAAEIAGEISLRQMYLALSMEIPVFQARCRLFFAQSLMQRGKLRAAQRMIRDVYAFSTSASAYDNPPEVHLSLMCHGLWKRLSHLWSLRRESRRLSRRLCVDLHADEIGALPSSDHLVGTNGSTSDTDNRRLFPDITAVLKLI